jgi:S1-C subfamily serine protease
MIRGLFFLLALATPTLAAPAESLVQTAWTHDAVTSVSVRLGIIPLVRPVVGEVTEYGSGTVIKSAGGRCWVLTCRHCAGRNAGTFRVLTPDADYKAEWVAADGWADLAVLRIKATLPAAEVATDDPPAGSQLYAYGHEGGGPQVPRAGRAFGYDGWAAEVWTPLGTVPVAAAIYWVGFRPEPGASGSGLLDARGRVVGVVWGRSNRPGERGCLATGLADVRRFLLGRYLLDK